MSAGKAVIRNRNQSNGPTVYAKVLKQELLKPLGEDQISHNQRRCELTLFFLKMDFSKLVLCAAVAAAFS